jgi:hypothetical protein
VTTPILLPDAHDIRAADYNRLIAATVQLGSSTDRPANPTRGMAVFETDTGNLLIYYGATSGWRPPWNLPWGEMATPSTSGVQTTSGGTELVLLTSSAFTPLANRRLRVYANCTGYNTVVGDQMRFTIRRGTTTAGAAIKVGPRYDTAVASSRYEMDVEAIDTSTAASTQFVFCAARLAGTGTYTMESIGTYDNYIMVEDIGPTGSAPAS